MVGETVTQPTHEFIIGSDHYPVLDAFMACREEVSVIRGPLGSAKTYGVLQRMLIQMSEQEPNAKGIRPTRWLAVRNSYPELASTTMKDFEAVFKGLGTLRMGGLEPPTFRVKCALPDETTVEAEVIFLALDREDAVRKIRGTQITGVWCNEMKELVKSVVDMLDDRHGRYPSDLDGGVRATWHGMMGDTNSPDEDHWLYRLAEEDKPERWAFFHQPGGVTDTGQTGPNGRRIWKVNEQAENLANLPGGSEYYRSKLGARTDDYIRVMYANEYGFTVDGKPVHPEYVDSVHTATENIELDSRYPLTVGVDFGRTPAAAICQYIEEHARWVVLDELTSENMSASIFGPQLKAYLDRHYSDQEVTGWGDPAGDAAGQTVEDTPIRILRASGIPIRPCETNRESLRRAAISGPAMRNSFIDGRPCLQVSPKAKMIRKGLMGGFCYRRLKVSGDEKYTDVPDKNIYSHPVEALEYALLGGGEGREALKPKVPVKRKRRQLALMD